MIKVKANQHVIPHQVGFIAAGMDRLAINCHDGVKSFEDFKKYKWISDRTMFVRYEDMANDPHQYAEQIYKFIGLEFDDETRSNFVAVTNRKTRKRRTVPNKSPVINVPPAKLALIKEAIAQRLHSPKFHKIDMFGASKSKGKNALLEGWRSAGHLTFQAVKEIESTCAKYMNLFHYNTLIQPNVKSMEHVRQSNLSSVEFLDDII